MGQLALMAGMSGLGALSGALSNRSKTTTSTSTSTPTWSGQYQGLNDRLLQGVTDRLANPAAGTEPLRINAVNNINRRYAALPQRIATNLAARGYGKSGALGSGIKGVEFARQSDMGDLESSFAQMLLNREDSNYSLAMKLLGMNAGQSSTGSQTTPGNVLGGLFSGGLSGLGAGMGWTGYGMGGGGGTGGGWSYPGAEWGG